MVNIEEYGVTIIPLPAKAFDLALSYQISDKQVDIYIPLWSEEEGQSDLTSLLILSIHSAAPKIRKESEGQTVWWEEFAGYSSQTLPHQQADGEDGQDDVCKKADHIIL